MKNYRPTTDNSKLQGGLIKKFNKDYAYRSKVERKHSIVHLSDV